MKPTKEEFINQRCLVCGFEVSSGPAICESCQGRYLCLMCGEELSGVAVKAGFAVCDSCRGYYFSERRVYYLPDESPGPAIVIRCDRRRPRGLARIKTPDLWIPMGGSFDFY